MTTVHRTVDGLRRALAPYRAGRIGLVPTMGAFHQGHVALFEAARRASGRVVATLFVNPAQFGNPADLATYPRDEARDREIAEAAGVDELFAPAIEAVYPPGFATWVDVEGAALGLEGAFRPGHFRGVATVCLKLFTIVQPTDAFFGQKDAQQVAVVTQMVRDLNVPVDIHVVPTVRDADGLALSSRNARLSPAERAIALAIPRALDAGVAAQASGAEPTAAARAVLDRARGLEVEYVAVADFGARPTLAIAARVGATRLIDNAGLGSADVPGSGPRGHRAALTEKG